MINIEVKFIMNLRGDVIVTTCLMWTEQKDADFLFSKGYLVKDYADAMHVSLSLTTMELVEKGIANAQYLSHIACSKCGDPIYSFQVAFCRTQGQYYYHEECQ